MVLGRRNRLIRTALLHMWAKMRCQTAWSRNWPRAGIDPIEAANLFIRDCYIAADNTPFRPAAEQVGPPFAAIRGVDLDKILCVQKERQVGNDNRGSFRRLKRPPRDHFVKARMVKVRHYPDGSHAVFHGQRCLGRYDGKGAFREDKKSLKSARRYRQAGPGSLRVRGVLFRFQFRLIIGCDLKLLEPSL